MAEMSEEYEAGGDLRYLAEDREVTDVSFFCGEELPTNVLSLCRSRRERLVPDRADIISLGNCQLLLQRRDVLSLFVSSGGLFVGGTENLPSQR